MYSVKQVADMSGRTERTIWRMLASGKLQSRKDEQGRVWIAEHDVPVRRPAVSASAVDQLRAEIAVLRERVAEVATLRERVEALEQRGLVRAVTRLSPVHLPTVRTAQVVEGVPTSARGWGTWVERHGGARAAGVRDRWQEIQTWSSIGEALEGIRHRGYQAHECDQAECGCHDVL